MPALLESSLPSLRLVSKGKVRDIYATSDPSTLLFVATDRISAYDVVLRNVSLKRDDTDTLHGFKPGLKRDKGIPEKGTLLNRLSEFWFEKLQGVVPNHMITTDVDLMPEDVRQYKDQLRGRSMLVKKAEVIPIEAIVRGYLTGSAWAEYIKSGTVHGIKLPSGLVESQRLPEPLFTPSTKAGQGQHDENIHPDQAAKLVGVDLYAKVSSISLRLYAEASRHAENCGLILADTKFEFGITTDRPLTSLASRVAQSNVAEKPPMSTQHKLILVDELLTPDSSRYWPKDVYSSGGPQPSFDKQYLRDWLKNAGFKKGLESGPVGKEGEGWVIDETVIEGTRIRYQEVVEKLMDQ